MSFRQVSQKAAGSFAETIIWHSENYTLEAVIHDTSTLVVTFEFAGPPFARANRYREGWGEGLFRGEKISALHVKPMQVDWYRRPDLVTLLRRIRKAGFFDQFDQVITYGGSMGGFAALVFADLVKANKAISLNPQSTLNRTKMPWENRFPMAQKNYDWHSEYSDVADHLNRATTSYVVYDKLFDLDHLHVERIKTAGTPVIELNIPFVGHQVPAHLVSIGAMKSLVFAVINGEPVAPDFYKQIRDRRKLARYFNILSDLDRVKNSRLFQSIVGSHKQKSPLIGMN